jgi:drug/metabolite transporter (DMT)-like permease
MINLLLWMLIYTFALALSQVLIRMGAAQIGCITLKCTKDVVDLMFALLNNVPLISGTVLMGSSFFLWIYILSWYKLSVAFPLTALSFIFVAILSHFLLGEKVGIFNYLGILLIACGIFFLLYKA